MARFKLVHVELDAEQQAEANRIAERLMPLFAEEAQRLAQLMASKQDHQLFGQTEFELRDRVHALGAEILEVTAQERVKKGDYQGASCVCPGCQCDARFVSRRSKSVLSLLGGLRLQRCYYGHTPWDAELGLDATASITPAVQEVTCIAGVQTSFAEASERTLEKLAGLRLSESTVERVTEAAGTRVAKQLHASKTFGASQSWAWHRDAQGKTCAYVSLDATGIRQQGPRGARAEGRMAYVGMIYNPRSAQEPRARRVESTPHQVR